MSRTKRTVFVTVLLVAIASAVAWWSYREPSVEGKPLSFWVSELRSEEATHREQASSILRRDAKRVVPVLAKRLSSSDSPLRTRFSRRHIRVGQGGKEIFASGDFARAMAATALGACGDEAVSVIPVIVAATNDPSALVSSCALAALIQIRNEPVTAQWVNGLTNGRTCIDALKAGSVLYALGTNADWIGSHLVARVKKGTDSERFDLINILCETDIEPSIAWPVILLALESDWIFKANALNATMIQLGRNYSTPAWSKRAQPSIVGCLTDTNVIVRCNAIAALSFSYPRNTNSIPPVVLRSLLADPDPGIRAWAESFQEGMY
jgi:hypothetical protein